MVRHVLSFIDSAIVLFALSVAAIVASLFVARDVVFRSTESGRLWLRKLFNVAALAAAVMLAIAPGARAQVFYSNLRIGSTIHTHSTVGTSTTLAISAGSVSSSLAGWRLCNDAVNTSTYLFLGEASDAATDGVQLDKAGCFECPNCSPATLKAVKLKAQAASNGYSITQFKP